VIEESFLVPIEEHPEILAFRLRSRIVSEGIEWNCDSLVEVVGAAGTEGGQPAGETPVPSQTTNTAQGRARKE
jgi:hypothetical protein